MNTPSSQKGPDADFIQSVFRSVSHNYDRANTVITFGLVNRWRKKLIQWSDAKKGDKILDCATGTGDLAFAFKKLVGPPGFVKGTDFCSEMLEVAEQKKHQTHIDVGFEWADVMALPFGDNTFDVTSIGYGIRNVESPFQALKEMARVTKPGGRVMIMETGGSQKPILRTCHHFYVNKIMPRLGGWITGRQDAYEYLNRSSQNFPAQQDFLDLMQSTNQYDWTGCQSLMGGASFLYKGVVSSHEDV